MKLHDIILTESQTSMGESEWIEAVKADCGDYLSLGKDAEKLWRGVNSNYGDFVIGKIPKNRTPRDASSIQTSILNHIYKKKYGINNIRNTGLFAHSNYNEATRYGNNIYRVIPVNASKIVSVGMADQLSAFRLFFGDYYLFGHGGARAIPSEVFGKKLWRAIHPHTASIIMKLFGSSGSINHLLSPDYPTDDMVAEYAQYMTSPVGGKPSKEDMNTMRGMIIELREEFYKYVAGESFLKSPKRLEQWDIDGAEHIILANKYYAIHRSTKQYLGFMEEIGL